jgi:hypothetical protein
MNDKEVIKQVELLPCPFCGGKASVEEYDVPPHGDYSRWRAGCWACCIFMDLNTEKWRAIEDWNARAALKTDARVDVEALKEECREHFNVDTEDRDDKIHAAHINDLIDYLTPRLAGVPKGGDIDNLKASIALKVCNCTNGGCDLREGAEQAIDALIAEGYEIVRKLNKA